MEGKVKSIQDNVAKVKEIDRSQRAQETIQVLEKDLETFSQQVKACESLQNTPEDKIKLLKNLSAVAPIGEGLSVLTPDNVLQGNLSKVNMSRQGAENLKKQVEKFRV